MAAERRMSITRRGSKEGGVWTEGKGYPSAPKAATGIEKSLKPNETDKSNLDEAKKQNKKMDKLTVFANKQYLTARAVAPALRLIPGLGPILAGATITGGRAIAGSVAEMKTNQSRGFGQSIGEMGRSAKVMKLGFSGMRGDFRAGAKTSLMGVKGMMGGVLGVLGTITQGIMNILPIMAMIAGAILAVLSISKFFRTMMGTIFGIISMMLDIALLPLMPIFMVMIKALLRLLPTIQAMASSLEEPMQQLADWMASSMSKLVEAFTSTILPWIINDLIPFFRDTLWPFLLWFLKFMADTGIGLLKALLTLVEIILPIISWIMRAVAAIFGAIGPGGVIMAALFTVAGMIVGAIIGSKIPFLGSAGAAIGAGIGGAAEHEAFLCDVIGVKIYGDHMGHGI